jgi:HPt (histidine-containing phosphotransfer) domain-containing protein
MTERLNEYFTQEAGDYLNRLAELLADPDGADPEEMLRLARGVRGSAQMAGVETIARIAERIEEALRAVTTNGVRWTEEVRQLAAETVRDIEVLMRALNRWGHAEEVRVRTAIERWDDLDPEAASEVPSIARFFYDDAGPHVVSEPPLPEGVVRIESLLLRGDDALREALALRPAVESAARGSAGAGDLNALLEELFDLVRLGSEVGEDRSATA